MITKYGLIDDKVFNLSARAIRDTVWGLMDPLELISGSIIECFRQFCPIWFLAIFSLGRRETSTFLAFPGLLRPRTLTSFNILPGIVFLYFWRGINWPQLTVFRKSCFIPKLGSRSTRISFLSTSFSSCIPLRTVAICWVLLSFKVENKSKVNRVFGHKIRQYKQVSA